MLRVDRHDDAERGCRLIEIALCNDRETPRKIPVDAWLYQTKLTVDGGRRGRVPAGQRPAAGYQVRAGRRAAAAEPAVPRPAGVRGRADLLGRLGRGRRARRASKVWTTWLPTCETPQVAAEEIDATARHDRARGGNPGALRAGLSPIVDSTRRGWTARRRGHGSCLSTCAPRRLDAVAEAGKVQQQLADGLEHLLADAEALRCFRFMNEVMADQRMQSQVARRRAQHPDESIDEARDAVLAEADQRALVAHVPARVHPHAAAAAHRPGGGRSGPATSPRRSCCSSRPVAARPRPTWGWRPTRSRSGGCRAIVETPDGTLDGGAGVAVLMRYTLRLLTAQQFQRAAALVCAAEMARPRRRGHVGQRAVPDRAVGRDRRVSPKWYEEAEEQLKRAVQRRAAATG